MQPEPHNSGPGLVRSEGCGSRRSGNSLTILLLDFLSIRNDRKSVYVEIRMPPRATTSPRVPYNRSDDISELRQVGELPSLFKPMITERDPKPATPVDLREDAEIEKMIVFFGEPCDQDNESSLDGMGIDDPAYCLF